MSRDAFLARVRQAAEMGRAYRVHLQPMCRTRLATSVSRKIWSSDSPPRSMPLAGSPMS